jgi:tetratricopeptide (TPR) repeat protein
LKNENKDSDDVLFLEGILALRKGNPENALNIFSRKPDAPKSLYGSALAFIALGDHEKSKDALTRALSGADPTIKTFSQTVLKAYGDFALFPEGQAIHLQTLLARALAQVNECETALKLVLPVVTVQPKYRDAWIVKGFCEFNTERTQEALGSLEQAYSLDPEKAEIQYFLARTHAALGDPENAVTFLQYALINGFRPERDARDLLADYALELGNTPLALEQLRLIAEAKDSDLSAYTRFIDVAASSSTHAPEAVSASKNALARWPDDVAALTLAGKAALAADIPNDAAGYIERALKIDPTNKAALKVQEDLQKLP